MNLDTPRSKTFEVDGIPPERVVCPEDVDEVVSLVGHASQNGYSVIPWGLGANMSLGNIPKAYHTALVCHGLRRTFDHAPGDLTLTVSAGYTLSEVNQRLAPSLQHLPLQAADPTQVTIGGALASGLSGPSRLGHGTLRDRLLWCQVVTADGQRVESGARVVKSVAGFDLGKLHIGAVGSLGIITAACFKLAPRPQVRFLALATFPSWNACARLRAILREARLTPTIFTLGVQGPGHGPHLGVLYFGVEGTPAGCQYQLTQLAKACANAGCHEPQIFASERADAVLQDHLSLRQQGNFCLRVIVLPDRVAPTIEALMGLAVPPQYIAAEMENGIITVTWADTTTTSLAMLPAVQKMIHDAKGTWRLDACPTAWKHTGLDVWGPPRPERALMRKLKTLWDPQGILAPGRSAGDE
ncbi:MAG: FAD-binding oxidoreductase [Candidatus Sericytochromatia bacterium]|nr:FAD-binding oxidoreductase [Candidatus Sericytochromatia bacterium]